MSDTLSLMQQLHEALVEQILAKVKSGEATAADFNVARQLLKDHGVNADPKRNPGLRELTESLPDLPIDMPLN